MRKLLKKSPADKKTAKDYKSINYNMSFNDRWHWTCDRTKDKFLTVVPTHSPLSPPSPDFLKNYDEIDWHRNEDAVKEETKANQ